MLELSDRLREDGIDSSIDLYEDTPPEELLDWTMRQITEADFILVVSSKGYYRQFRGEKISRRNNNNPWQRSIVVSNISNPLENNAKYIPITIKSNESQFIPNPLRSVKSYQTYIRDEYELLLQRLMNLTVSKKKHVQKQQSLPKRDKKQTFYTEPLHNLPHRRYSKLIGREAEIKTLLHRVSEDYRPHINVVSGIGGIGKTALVLEAAYRLTGADIDGVEDTQIPNFDAIIFTSSKATDLSDTILVNRPEKESSIFDIFRLIAEVLEEPTITQVPKLEQAEQVRKALAKQSTLLIVDNLETLTDKNKQEILEFLHNVPVTTQAIITTRESIGFTNVSITGLKESESIALIDIQAEAKGVKITTQQKKQIYKKFGGIPVALLYSVGQHAAGYSFVDILKPSTKLSENLGKFCFETSVEPLRGKAEYQILLAMTFFRDSPTKDAVVKIAGLVVGTQTTVDAIARLKQLSLITEEDGYFHMLTMTREYMLHELDRYTNNQDRDAMQKRWLDWYSNFVKQFGGEDWENWRAKYDRIEREWRNIESILYWYTSQEDWDNLYEFWEKIDNYVDLNRYWQKRRHWWSLLKNRADNIQIKIKALSEGAWTSMFMGSDSHNEAENCLKEAWKLRNSVNPFIQADIANHFAILEKGKSNYPKAREWLDKESEIIENTNLPERERIRHQAQNLFYWAEINYVDGDRDAAKQQFELVIELCDGVKWQRFKNYAQNALADIAIEEGDLERAEELILNGLSYAESSREKRRIALYHASYANLSYQLAIQSEDRTIEYIIKAQEYADRAIEVFRDELMVREEEQIGKLLVEINLKLSPIGIEVSTPSL